MTNKTYRKYWPEMVNKEVSKREKWTTSEISVDHPKRKEEAVRDPTIFTAGLTTTITGLHCDIAVLDDVVVYENAYTEEGRNKVKSQASLLASIQGADGEEMVVGTRYHPSDLYQEMMETEEDTYNDAGEITGSNEVYEIFERQVEDAGDGTGEFLWPRQQRYDGKWFGFNREILAKKRAKYWDQTQFRAQYYNDPNSGANTGIDRSKFQYYDKTFLTESRGSWVYKDRKLNILAAVDFAYSTKEKADYTSIVVAGMDSQRNVYVLDIDRFKTEKISHYYERILALYKRWQFRKLVAEVNAAQKPIVDSLKNDYFKPEGIPLSIIEEKPTRHDGAKEQRIEAILEPLYYNGQVWHYRGGNCQVLEDELILRFPPHDDVKDSFSNCANHLVPPANTHQNNRRGESNVITHARFGGVIGA